jgi:hypothetical protein
MNDYEVYALARNAAADAGGEWSDAVQMRRFALWPPRPISLLWARVGEDGTGWTIVVVDERTERASVHRIRPWSDYEWARLVGLPILFLSVAACAATAILRVLNFFWSSLASAVSNPILAGIVAAAIFFTVPLMRVLGKDRWILRRELREVGAPEGEMESAEPDVVTRPVGRKTVSISGGR